MVDLVKGLFPEVADKIEAYEIVGSYCPCSYDLSIEGKNLLAFHKDACVKGWRCKFIYVLKEVARNARHLFVTL